jgi:hypothetical protein
LAEQEGGRQWQEISTRDIAIVAVSLFLLALAILKDDGENPAISGKSSASSVQAEELLKKPTKRF